MCQINSNGTFQPDEAAKMLVEAPNRHHTPEEYLQLEAAAAYKNEYRDGEIVPMTGGTTNHNEITGNIFAHLKFGLRGKNYRVYIGDVQLWIPQYRQYTYPGVMVIAGEPVYTGTNTTTVMNPALIIEVLSKSTKNYDQGDKFLYYRSIPEFKEYILVDQTEYRVMQYAKTADKKWLLTEYQSAEDILNLEVIEYQIQIGEIYEKVNFAEVEE